MARASPGPGAGGEEGARRATQSKTALGHGAQKTFSNMPFAFGKKIQTSFVLLSSETSFLTRKYLYLEITVRMLFTPPGLSEAFCWSSVIHTLCGSDQFIKHWLGICYEPSALLVSEFNRMKKTRYNPEVAYTVTGGDFVLQGDICNVEMFLVVTI